MKWSEEILEIRVDKQVDPDRSQLRHVLEAQFRYERVSMARSTMAHLLAIVGILIWLEGIWPDLLPEEARFFTFVFWGSMLFVTVSIALEEFVLSRKLASYLARKGGVSLHKPGESS
jgi:hypothetical protein